GVAPERARWIAVGGGAVPEAIQVQIEQDIALAIDVLAGDGIVLFGAGAGAQVVQVENDAPERDPIGAALADLFAPRGGRNARYRAPQIAIDGPATAARVLDTIARAAQREGDPLLVFVAGHGEIGEHARNNTISLWQSSVITVEELASTLDAAKRTTRVVATTCFSGGFAELAFGGASEESDAAPTLRCGLFASPWDLEAAGCDPNPDRAAQEGYALHFLAALRGQDRAGTAISGLDLDGDGAIGLLDAHTRVVIASAGPDVPTTTSERWLRARAPAHGHERDADVPEDDAVIAALGKQLGLAGHEVEARDRLAAIERRIATEDAALAQAQQAQDAAFRIAAAELLAKWPVLDDPWHPEFSAVFRRDREAIGKQLEGSSSYAEYLAAQGELAKIETRLADLAVEAAPFERLVRALDNRTLARRLTAAGGPALATWQRLRSCERLPP
ncbi:MAG TPA: hypothetical protein VG755_07505, partial [Nannocystaceae bacterium]|nr:hypothetical protein [Nannocystaceae bacterium]